MARRSPRVTLPPALHRRLATTASALGRRPSALVSDAVREYLDGPGRKAFEDEVRRQSLHCARHPNPDEAYWEALAEPDDWG